MSAWTGAAASLVRKGPTQTVVVLMGAVVVLMGAVVLLMGAVVGQGGKLD